MPVPGEGDGQVHCHARLADTRPCRRRSPALGWSRRAPAKGLDRGVGPRRVLSAGRSPGPRTAPDVGAPLDPAVSAGIGRPGGTRSGSAFERRSISRYHIGVESVASVDDGAGFSAAVAAITSAFGDATRRSIYLLVRDSEGLTATEVASVSPSTPKWPATISTKLAAAGQSRSSWSTAAPASDGRPSATKQRRSGDTSGVPAHRDDLLVLLLARLLPLVDPRRPRRWPTRSARVRANASAPDGPRRGSAVRPVGHAGGRRALTAHGFAPRAAGPAENTVVHGHCPFGRAAMIIRSCARPTAAWSRGSCRCFAATPSPYSSRRGRERRTSAPPSPAEADAGTVGGAGNRAGAAERRPGTAGRRRTAQASPAEAEHLPHRRLELVVLQPAPGGEHHGGNRRRPRHEAVSLVADGLSDGSSDDPAGVRPPGATAETLPPHWRRSSS